MASSDHKVSYESLSKHNKKDDVWIVVENYVYDMTRFAAEHPGGPDIIYAHASRDATQAYLEVHEASLIQKELDKSEQIGPFDKASAPADWGKPKNEVPAEDEKPPLMSIINLNDFEEAAERTISKKNMAFIWGAANDNFTRDANKDFFRRIWFRPRILRNVGTVSTKSKMLGHGVSMPVWISPTGLGKAGGPEGELGLAAGAASQGIVYCISTTASFPLSEILSKAPKSHPFFFQLYVDKQRHKTEKLLQEINNSPQIKAIFVTVDLAVVSKREADERLKVEMIHTSGITGQSTSTDAKGAGMARSVGSFIDPTLSWDDLAWLRKHTKLPIVLKGIQSAADAREAMRMGCQGIVVSNHGGRALDTAPASILVLLELHLECPEIFDVMEVFIDGGIRRGSDILKAICLGASGVGLGRSYMYALNYGVEGVERATIILQDELETAMRLCGLSDLSQADPSYLNTAELDPLVPRGPRHPYARKHMPLGRHSRL